MSDKSLRSRIIRLANANPLLREHLVPMLRSSATSPDYEWWDKNGRSFKSKTTRAKNMVSKDPYKALRMADDLYDIMERRGYSDNWHAVKGVKDDAENRINRIEDWGERGT
jgi:hypothetical protein